MFTPPLPLFLALLTKNILWDGNSLCQVLCNYRVRLRAWQIWQLFSYEPLIIDHVSSRLFVNYAHKTVLYMVDRNSNANKWILIAFTSEIFKCMDVHFLWVNFFYLQLNSVKKIEIRENAMISQKWSCLNHLINWACYCVQLFLK